MGRAAAAGDLVERLVKVVNDVKENGTAEQLLRDETRFGFAETACKKTLK